MSMCKYYRENENDMYVPECTGDSVQVRERHIENNTCQFCGKEIELKENTEVPEHLQET